MSVRPGLWGPYNTGFAKNGTPKLLAKTLYFLYLLTPKYSVLLFHLSFKFLSHVVFVLHPNICYLSFCWKNSLYLISHWGIVLIIFMFLWLFFSYYIINWHASTIIWHWNDQNKLIGCKPYERNGGYFTNIGSRFNVYPQQKLKMKSRPTSINFSLRTTIKSTQSIGKVTPFHGIVIIYKRHPFLRMPSCFREFVYHLSN